MKNLVPSVQSLPLCLFALEMRFLTYSLTGLIPSLASTLHIQSSGSHEIMAISSAFAVRSSHESLQLYDLNYQSLRCQKDTSKTRHRHLKRDREAASHEGTGVIKFVAYFPQSARIIGKRGPQLLAVDIPASPSKRQLETGSSLLQNIGRGVRRSDIPSKGLGKEIICGQDRAVLDPTVALDWKHTRQRLDHLAQAGDVGGFEDAFVDAAQSTSSQQSFDSIPSNFAASTEHMVDYLLSKIFELEASSGGAKSGHHTGKKLKVCLPSAKCIRWVCRLGLLSGNRVSQALAGAAGSVGQMVAVQAVAQALLDADSSCALLMTSIANGFSPYVEEQAAVVQVLIQRALDMSETSETIEEISGALANGAMDVDGALVDPEVPVKTFSASTENPMSSATLHEALVAALDRLGTAASPSISRHLKAAFSQRQVLALIQFLRQQLFQAGHTQSYQSRNTEEDLPHNVALNAIVKILSGCVDAVGPLGFLGALDNEEFIGNVVPELLTEITNTKQSLEEVSELRGILREALRYQESIERQQRAGARLPMHATGQPLQQRPGAIMTLFSDAVEGEEDIRPGTALPLSLKSENVVSPTKIRKGGGQVQKRSAQQKMMLEGRNKGQYTFERLVL